MLYQHRLGHIRPIYFTSFLRLAMDDPGRQTGKTEFSDAFQFPLEANMTFFVAQCGVWLLVMFQLVKQM